MKRKPKNTEKNELQLNWRSRADVGTENLNLNHHHGGRERARACRNQAPASEQNPLRPARQFLRPALAVLGSAMSGFFAGIDGLSRVVF